MAKKPKSLVDVLRKNLNTPDPVNPPKVSLVDKLFTIIHSSKN